MSSVVSSAVTRSVCLLHPDREAAAKCVQCNRSFCRECITPVDRRMMCAACFREKTGVKAKPKRDWFLVSLTAQTVLGLLGLWLTAYFFGRILLELPSSFHEGTIWEQLVP